MIKDYKNILAVDGSYMLHRALRSQWDLTNPNTGERTGGIYQFIRSLQYEVKKNNHFPVVVWDSGLSPRRVKLYPQYKKADERAKSEFVNGKVVTGDKDSDDYLNEYIRQRKLIIEFLEYVGIPSIKIKNWEGDDLLVLVSRMSKDLIVVTDDKDLIQLLSPTTKIRRSLADQTLELNEYLSSNNYDDIKEMVHVKAIVGDPSDNIPQVGKGLGEVSAKAISKVIYHNPDNYLDVLISKDYLDTVNKRMKTAISKFIENHDRYLINMGLVDLELVDNDSRVVSILESSITQSANSSNYFKAVKFLGSQSISTISVDEIISKIKLLSTTILS